MNGRNPENILFFMSLGGGGRSLALRGCAPVKHTEKTKRDWNEIIEFFGNQKRGRQVYRTIVKHLKTVEVDWIELAYDWSFLPGIERC